MRAQLLRHLDVGIDMMRNSVCFRSSLQDSVSWIIVELLIYGLITIFHDVKKIGISGCFDRILVRFQLAGKHCNLTNQICSKEDYDTPVCASTVAVLRFHARRWCRAAASAAIAPNISTLS
jgi:hypothetical protein